MTSIRNISRGLGAGLLGLSLIASLTVGGCGNKDNGGGTSTFVEPGLGPGSTQTGTATQLTRVSYQFGSGGLPVDPDAAFYDITLRDSSGAPVIVRRFAAAASAQIDVPDTDVSRIASTTVDVVLPDGSIREHFEKALTLTEDQTTVVSSATSSTATLTAIKISTTSEQGRLSIEQTGTLQMVTGASYQLVPVGIFSTGNTTSLSNLTKATFSTSDATVAFIENGVLVANATAAALSMANVTASFQGVTGVLPVKISGIGQASPTPTPTPTPSPTTSPTPRPSPTPLPGASPSPGG